MWLGAKIDSVRLPPRVEKPVKTSPLCLVMIAVDLVDTNFDMSKQHSEVDTAAAAADEREKKIAEERALAALKLQRKQRLQAMSIKRQRNFEYLKACADDKICASYFYEITFTCTGNPTESA